jgi:hypothetical protein
MNKKKQVYPLLLVLSAISIIELLLTNLYGQLNTNWERQIVLIAILSIPISIVSTFIYLWLRKPGFIYPPSEFGDGEDSKRKLIAYRCGPECAYFIQDEDSVTTSRYTLIDKVRDRVPDLAH